jgi:hypothetical protein
MVFVLPLPERGAGYYYSMVIERLEEQRRRPHSTQLGGVKEHSKPNHSTTHTAYCFRSTRVENGNQVCACLVSKKFSKKCYTSHYIEYLTYIWSIKCR